MSRRHPTALDCTESKVLTKQSFKDECNINNIMAKWMRDGTIDHMAKNPPTYGDFSTVDEYQTAQNKVLMAQASFDAMPAKIRDRMDNDPATFMAFMQDPANNEEAISLGLIPAPPRPTYPAPPDATGGAPQGAAASGEGTSPPSPANTPNPTPSP